jgi:hypothetical protein
MLNYPTQDREDKDLLRGSFESLSNHESVTIVSDSAEIDHIFKVILNSLTLPEHCRFSIANLFKIKTDDSQVFIAQCLYDYRFTINSKGWISDRYDYKLIGFAHLSSDYGKMLIRPETKSDKIIGKFFRSDIQIANADEFNKEYYLAAEDAAKAKQFFNPAMVKVLAKSKGVNLMVNTDRVFISIENAMTEQQTVLIARILQAITPMTK